MSSTSKTTQVLRLPEVLHHILELVAADLSKIRDSQAQGDARRSLAMLARTSRIFSEVSLNLLWRRLDSLVPLISSVHLEFNVDLPNPPSPAQWKVINRYTPRIRELEIPATDWRSCEFLQATSFGRLSLPNLRVLKWNPRNDLIDFIHMRPLLSPSLVSLDVCTDEDSVVILLAFFKNYPLLCPNLTAVKLHLVWTENTESRPDKIIQAISTGIAGQLNLESLALSTSLDTSNLDNISLGWGVRPLLDDATLNTILRSPKLKMLSLLGCKGSECYSLENVSIPPSDIPLRNIKELCLPISHLPAITNLLRPHDQGFRQLRLQFRTAPTDDSMQEFYTALATAQRQDSLESIVFDWLDLDEAPTDWTRGCLSYNTICPLMSAHRLRELVVHLFSRISITDDELARMASSWPSLEVLSLAGPHTIMWPQENELTSLAGLLPLLAFCPNLRELVLPLDARDVPESTPADPLNTAIKALQLGQCPISDSDRVAHFLRGHFPSLLSVQKGQFLRGRYSSLWSNVEKKLLLLPEEAVVEGSSLD